MWCWNRLLKYLKTNQNKLLLVKLKLMKEEIKVWKIMNKTCCFKPSTQIDSRMN